ncbi:MAG: hypothetical protein IJG62_06655 [Synergistaceae bacterium]|nr:hypothetical protein [Synergistaceae bacterium]MBQ3625971.1 hypothetical protein [Synergistaceae bacterium]MBQ4418790.1 hypothetical protein [Synergistaceae bacterium]MBQ7569674.1 hypothetical protein [Synergistaceae bacterium]MBQ9581163.1 hypothetical protein [Synergistaceae bacterium]
MLKKFLAFGLLLCGLNFILNNNNASLNLNAAVHKLVKIFALIILILINNNFAYAHGTGWRVSDFKALSLEFAYSDGELMSYCEAKIYSPSDNKIAFQTMRTDELGRAAFTPNQTGEWRVIVNDNQGHRAEAKINIENLDNNNLNLNSQAPALSLSQGIYIRALLGVSLLFNIAAIILLKRRGK